jgi:hypothetical protein
MNFLIDYNLRGQAVLLWGTIATEGWLDIVPIRFVGFEEVGLLENSSDRLVWLDLNLMRYQVRLKKSEVRIRCLVSWFTWMLVTGRDRRGGFRKY